MTYEISFDFGYLDINSDYNPDQYPIPSNSAFYELDIIYMKIQTEFFQKIKRIWLIYVYVCRVQIIIIFT